MFKTLASEKSNISIGPSYGPHFRPYRWQRVGGGAKPSKIPFPPPYRRKRRPSYAGFMTRRLIPASGRPTRRLAKGSGGAQKGSQPGMDAIRSNMSPRSRAAITAAFRLSILSPRHTKRTPG